jgi:hypothetical protein
LFPLLCLIRHLYHPLWIQVSLTGRAGRD